MPTAHIFNEHLEAAERAAIEEAVRAAGYEPVYGVPSNAGALDSTLDVGVVGLPVAPEDETNVNAAIQAFAGAGIRVVCVWLHGAEGGGTGVPEGVDKYGTTIDIGSSELIEVLKGETDVWEEPGGEPRPVPTTKRNKC
ncbi:MAG: hypothetical protein V2I43_21800 [Parvularcula sp.]|jgi:hypothetical protein|nr:hypothetical protein [Parvularcula sp.]